MNWRSALAHRTLTGHGQFYQPDPTSDAWVCLLCPDAPVLTCQYPISTYSLCSSPVHPGTPFCPHHQPISHFLPLFLET